MGLVTLLIQCVAMFVASIVVGSLPLMFRSASGKNLEAVSVFGMGILVSAALTIIIPEGVETVYDSIPSGDHAESPHGAIGLSLLAGFALMLIIESLTPHPPHPGEPSSAHSSPPTASTPLRSPSPDARPLPVHLNSTTPIMPKQMHVYDEREGCHKSSDAVRGLNATLGLVIHGAADGIALGASSLSGKGNLSLVVFIAVLVHKGPTALGLTTTLLSLDLDHPAIRKRLLIFSCAAPLGAILTYLLTSVFGRHLTGHATSEIDALSWWTGVVLLFSGGSFLYVATVIQPISAADSDQHAHGHGNGAHDGHGHGHSHGHGHGNEQASNSLSKYARIAWIGAGMVVPVLLTWIVGGEH